MLSHSHMPSMLLMLRKFIGERITSPSLTVAYPGGLECSNTPLLRHHAPFAFTRKIDFAIHYRRKMVELISYVDPVISGKWSEEQSASRDFCADPAGTRIVNARSSAHA